MRTEKERFWAFIEKLEATLKQLEDRYYKFEGKRFLLSKRLSVINEKVSEAEKGLPDLIDRKNLYRRVGESIEGDLSEIDSILVRLDREIKGIVEDYQIESVARLFPREMEGRIIELIDRSNKVRKMFEDLRDAFEAVKKGYLKYLNG